MPLILDESALEGLDKGNGADNNAPAPASTLAIFGTQKAQKFTPKWFSKDLNGNGTKATGRINNTVGPDNPNLDLTFDIHTIVRKRKVVNDKATYRDIPISVAYSTVRDNAYDLAARLQQTLPITGVERAVCLLDPRDGVGDYHQIGVWVVLRPQAVTTQEKKVVDVDGSASTEYQTAVAYVLNIVFSRDYTINADDTVTFNASDALPCASEYDALKNIKRNQVKTTSMVAHTWDPREKLREITPDLYNQDCDIEGWLTGYSVYDELSAAAAYAASDDALDECIAYTDTVFTFVKNTPTQQSQPITLDPHDPLVIALAQQFIYLESFNLSLSAYSKLYTVLQNHAAAYPAVVKALIAQNMQLALNNNLNDLKLIANQLPATVEDPNNPYPMPQYYSTQQRNAITSDAPLTIVSSGAGTGKSTVILERMKFIQHCGFGADTINVLSFTNAAADNIAEKNPGVRSRTFASQIAEIYTHNFPTHKQSNLDTIINSISIQYATQLRQNEPVVTDLIRLLRSVAKQGDGARVALTKLNTFIEHHQRECLDIFNTIQQTSLELQIIICYQLIDQLKEPFAPPQHLIVDEVQDTSIFEFVYILRYVAKHKANLYIVGDASQTLYEFRAANPKALNSLEASGIFTCHRLTTNYRSNQEILDFANIHLSNIDANSWAKIQLRANSLDSVTAASFQEKITVKHHRNNNLNQLSDELSGVLMGTDVREYIQGCLDRGEQVAFLANTRREAASMQETLVAMYPQHVTMSLVPDRVYSNVIFSRYVMEYWDEVLAVPPADAPFIFTTQVMAHINHIAPTSSQKLAAKKADQAKNMLLEWWTQSQADVTALIHAQNAGAISRDQFFDQLKDNILDFEIKKNNANQHNTGRRNRARKEQSQSDAHFFTSTIHSVKGLEFDNVVLVHRPVDNADEEAKRLYYVALTRAKNTEFIIAVAKATMPKLVTDYRTMVASLEQAEAEAEQAEIEAAIQQNNNADPANSADTSAAVDDTVTDNSDNGINSSNSPENAESAGSTENTES